jgi:ATP-dependent Clp protease ATP-binding subunit ClpC
VKRAARGQGIELEVDGSLVDHFAADGFRPEFGARELRRLIRSELETSLAREMLGNDVQEGERVVARWDSSQQRVVLDQSQKQDGSESEQAKSDAQQTKKLPATRPHKSAAE